jgi:hypothetical protein
MTWNYRIIKRTAKDEPKYYYALNEVFYKEDGTLMAYSEEDTIVGSSPKEIIEILEMMLADAKKDALVLTEQDFNK